MALCGAMGACEEQRELLLLQVQVAISQLTARLKKGIFPEDCGPAFPLAAAMTAMDRLCEMTRAEEITSFTVGDLTIRKESGDKNARRPLAIQAERLLAPWLEETGFAFQGVAG